MIDEALDEVFELSTAIEFDEEFMGDATNFIEPRELRDLKQSMDSGNHSFGGSAPHFMDIIKTAQPHLIHFKFLLTTINRVHTKGLASDTDS